MQNLKQLFQEILTETNELPFETPEDADSWVLQIRNTIETYLIMNYGKFDRKNLDDIRIDFGEFTDADLFDLLVLFEENPKLISDVMDEILAEQGIGE